MTPTEYPKSMARVMFGQLYKGCVTAALEHAVGPLIEGETVFAYEVDGDDLLYTEAEVVEFDTHRRRALLRVDHRQIRIADQSFDHEKPAGYFMKPAELLAEDPLAIPA